MRIHQLIHLPDFSIVWIVLHTLSNRATTKPSIRKTLSLSLTLSLH